MPNGRIYVGRQRGRGSDMYYFRAESSPGEVIATEDGLSQNQLRRRARLYKGYIPAFDDVPHGLQDQVKRALRS